MYLYNGILFMLEDLFEGLMQFLLRGLLKKDRDFDNINTDVTEKSKHRHTHAQLGLSLCFRVF